MDLLLLLVGAEWGEATTLLLMLPRAEVLVVLQLQSSFSPVDGQGFPPRSRILVCPPKVSYAWPLWWDRRSPTPGHVDLRPPWGLFTMAASQLSAAATLACASASYTLSILEKILASSARRRHSLSSKACQSYCSSRVSKYMVRCTTVGLSSCTSRPSKASMRALHTRRFLSKGGKNLMGVRPMGSS
jgi:hypothetical protein